MMPTMLVYTGLFENGILLFDELWGGGGVIFSGDGHITLLMGVINLTSLKKGKSSMSKVSKESLVFLFVMIAGMGMLRINTRTYADPGNTQITATPSHTPMSNYLPMILKPAGTPTVTATATATATSTATSTSIPTAGDVQIVYIEYNPPGSDVDGEYVSIKNMGGTTQDMTGWKLRDSASNSYTFPTFSLGPISTVQVWTGDGTNSATNLYMKKGWSIWNNNGDTATLFDAASQQVDTCTYGGGGTGASCP